jgi:hypothetical protein
MGGFYPSFTLGSFLIDLISAACLAGAGVYGILVARKLQGAPRRFWAVAGAGLIWLGADEMFGLHEGIEMLLDAVGVPQAPLVHSTNDALLIGYAAIGAYFGLRNLRELGSHPVVLGIMIAAAISLVAAVTADAFFTPDPTAAWIEEDGELAGGALFLAALWLRHRIAAGEQQTRTRGSIAAAAS